jgi:DNA-binding beta-propeller fold protein YncE
MARSVAAVCGGLLLLLLLADFLPGTPSGSAPRTEEQRVPPLLLAGGRRLEFVRAFSSETEVHPRRSVWKKVVDLVAGPPSYARMLRPYAVVSDSTGRVIVTDPDSATVQIFDFETQKHRLLTGDKRRRMLSPQGIAVDARDNIYVTDSRLGVVFVFDRGGKLQRLIGSEKNGRGLFARPTGIAVDSAANRLYVTDTARHQVFLLDLQGKVLRSIGTRGTQPGQFNFPTELLLHGGELLVVDAMNFRIQTFSRDGAFLRAFGSLGNRTGALLRPKGLALDSEGNIYVADALLETVQVFDREGNLLYFFGHSGGAEGEFQLPAGLFIDPRDRIYVADSLNQRVQVFQFRAAPRARSGGQP